MIDPRIKEMCLYAWVGENEYGDGTVGLKQARVPAGYIALVSVEQQKLTEHNIPEQLQALATQHGRTIRLCRFAFVEEVMVLAPGTPPPAARAPKPRAQGNQMARLVKYNICNCGYCGYPALTASGELPPPAIPLGTVFEVDAADTKSFDWTCGGCGKLQRVEAFFVYATLAFNAGYLPKELFEVID